jgi:phage gpG-like protein
MIRIKPVSPKDTKAFRDFVESLKTTPKVLEQISRDMADETVGLVQDGFREETDPYGDRWTPKQAQDGRKTLSGKTSRLKGGWHVSARSSRGFTVSPAVNYARFHQSGTRRMPRRAMVPFEGRIPAKWLSIYRDVFVDRMTLHFNKSGTNVLRSKLRRFARKVL